MAAGCDSEKGLGIRDAGTERTAGNFGIGAAGWSVNYSHAYHQRLDGISQWNYLGVIGVFLCLFLRWEFEGHGGNGSYTGCFRPRELV